VTQMGIAIHHEPLTLAAYAIGGDRVGGQRVPAGSFPLAKRDGGCLGTS
jgi:hypothetical protein